MIKIEIVMDINPPASEYDIAKGIEEVVAEIKCRNAFWYMNQPPQEIEPRDSFPKHKPTTFQVTGLDTRGG